MLQDSRQCHKKLTRLSVLDENTYIFQMSTLLRRMACLMPLRVIAIGLL